METPPQLIPPIMLPARLSLLGWLRPELLTDIGTAPLPYCGVKPDMLIESWRPEVEDLWGFESKLVPGEGRRSAAALAWRA